MVTRDLQSNNCCYICNQFGVINTMKLLTENRSFSQSREILQHIFKIFIIGRGTLLTMHLISLSFANMNGDASLWHAFSNNHYLDSFLRWDSGWYRDIIKEGYSYNPEKQSNVAFFPLYPLLVKIISSVFFISSDIAGILLSNILLFFALFFVYKISSVYLKKRGTERVLILMLIFPTSFFYSCFYTESLYLLTTAASFWFFLKKQYFFAGIFGFLASLTRVTGVLIFLSCGVELCWNYSRKKEVFNKEILYLLLIPCGLITYMLFLYWQFNEPLAFIKIQDLWARGDKTFPLITLAESWKNINFFFPKDSHNTIQFLELFFSIYFLVLGIFAFLKNLLTPSLLIFSLVSILLPLSTGTTTSMLRYILPLFPIFIILGYLSKNRYFYWFLCFSFTYLLSTLFLWYANWYWVA